MLTIEDDGGEFEATRARLEAFDELNGLAGLFDAELAERGARHELGRGVPARPWLSASTDGMVPKLGTLAESKVGDVVADGESADAAMGTLAQAVADSAQDYVRSGKVGGPPLSAQAKKRDPRKLIDTGEMVGAVVAKVVSDREVPAS